MPKESVTWKDLDLYLAGVKYSVSVLNAAEEALVLSVAEDLNSAYDKMRQEYADKVSRAALLAMLLLTRASQLREAQTLADTSVLQARLEALDHVLDTALAR